MTVQAVLIELLERMGNSPEAAVFVNEVELSQWPSAAVKALKTQKLITKVRPPHSAVCPGCEQDCVMPVYSMRTRTDAPAAFIVCDKRNDTNRVPIPLKQLSRWQCRADHVCGFVADCLELHRNNKIKEKNGFWEIGIASGKKRKQMLGLQLENGKLFLTAGDKKVPLVELIEFNDGRYFLDHAAISRLVDTTTTTDKRYTPSNARREARKLETQEMHKGWAKAYREQKKQYPNRSDTWHAKKIAGMEIAQGRSSETIRKNMKK